MRAKEVISKSMDKKETLFKILNDYFDQIYIISLKRSTDRHKYIKKVLDGLDYQFLWGIDGQELSIDQLEKEGRYHSHLTKLLKKRKGRVSTNLSLARIGCALSHIEVYLDILKNGYKNALILEDDLYIDVSAIDTVEKALVELPENWQVLYFGHWGANSDPSFLLRIQKNILFLLSKGFQKFERLRMMDPEVIQCWFPRSYSENLELSGAHHGTYAYAVTNEGAKKILNFQIPVVQEIDNAIAELSSYQWINAFNLKKRVFYPNLNIPSTING